MSTSVMEVQLGRPSVRSRAGIVATSQRHASEAGTKILAAGGNAADAAIASAAALAVTEPCSCGLGGDCFALFFNAKSGSVTSLNGSGRSPLSLSIDRLAKTGAAPLTPFSPHTVTVPGAAAAWHDLRDRHGSLPMPALMAPAIELADQGFGVGPITAHFWQLGAAMQLGRWPGNPTDLAPNDRGPNSGELFRNPNMAGVLDELGEAGKENFYTGRIGQAITTAVRARGGWLDDDDLAAHLSEWSDPISAVHHGTRVYECPPNGQGLTALLALQTLSALEESASSLEAFDDPRRVHREIESLRLAFADARSFIADPAANDLPTETLLSDDYARSRAARIDRARASVNVVAGSPSAFSDTVYLSVVDGDGNACSLIFSNYMGFGTGIIPEGCGFTLQNRGHNFSLEPGHANALAGGKRPYHTIIPALATEDGKLKACFGVMGGFMQPQGHVQTLRGLVCDGADPQEILDRPRFLIDPASDGSGVALEETYSPELGEQLSQMGHAVRIVDSWQRSAFGRGQMIVKTDDELIGGSDPRGDGCAIGL